MDREEERERERESLDRTAYHTLSQCYVVISISRPIGVAAGRTMRRRSGGSPMKQLP